MKGALEKISEVPPDQLPSGDKIWARNIRELSYDIEDNIDTFMVQVKGHHQPAKKLGFAMQFGEKILGPLMQLRIRRKIAIDIREIRGRVVEVHDRRRRYEVNYSVDKPVKVDPRALVQYEKVTELVGIEELRDKVIKILMEGSEVSKEQDKIVSLVGFGGLGKTTLANVVYEKLRPQFDCSAFVSVSQTPDMVKLFKDIFYKLDKEKFEKLAIYNVASVDVINNELRKFLRQKRYLVIIDDIWEISDWKTIRCALPDDSVEYRIITTTPEGFIQPEKQDKSLFEIGENYLNELINLSMIQPRHDKSTGMIESCRVHDMVLDLICSLSREENFVTVQINMVHSSASKKLRRLSLQNGKASHGKLEAMLSKERAVRSVILFQSVIDNIPTVLENFSILRVLDLEGCDLSQGYSLKYLGNLLHLRYLSLRDTRIDELPEEIGNLQFLQMLDIYTEGKAIHSLPSAIVQLTQLMCLRINIWMTVIEGIGSLIALEELSCLRISYEKKKMLEELGQLTELKVLDLEIITADFISGSLLESVDDLDKSVVECLNKLQKIHTWLMVNPSRLVSLSSLDIAVKRLQQEDLEILGRLPALGYLDLRVGHKDLGIIHGRFLVGARSFPWLVHCLLLGFGEPMVFQQGAMPRLVDLSFDFPVQRTREIINGSFDLGLGNLPSLQDVWVNVRPRGASMEEVREAKAALRHVIEVVHPNHPTLHI
ncbi:unnamed protein product [Miscanthus lutarioriparius]|uniref:AAA+ ATPase domain-containing protein n=1 Tax=Miscanthus lutarioriparius TaxID=422564 RepID=A0A811RGF4_9POAL|nr:unnamed protein product [Miscanthus lutarioriparius]